MSDQSEVPVHPAATVVLLRDGADGLDILFVRRNAALDFHGGAWVFPGGRIDPPDYAGGDDVEQAARRAAVREAHEEAGVEISAEDLVHIANWTTPAGLPKRFAAWFYAVAAGREEVRVDGGEIDDYRWMRPAAAIVAHDGGEIMLPPPTFVTTLQLAEFITVEEALSALSRRDPGDYVPRAHDVPGGRVSLYEGDAGYDTRDPDCPGPRNRLWLVDSGWRYERSR